MSQDMNDQKIPKELLDEFNKQKQEEENVEETQPPKRRIFQYSQDDCPFCGQGQLKDMGLIACNILLRFNRPVKIPDMYFLDPKTRMIPMSGCPFCGRQLEKPINIITN